MVCTKLNGTSKVICSNGLEVKSLCPAGTLANECILAYEGGADAIEAKGTPNFGSTATTDEGMYAAEDDYGTSYYYRGAVNDNWVQFGTNSSGQSLYWRIVRINGDGTIRLIYNGTSTSQTGDSTMINTSQAFNSGWDDNMYVGYMYQSRLVHGLQNDSDIKTTIDNWYASNLADEAEYLEGSTGFCGDRYPSTSSSSSNGSGGTGRTQTYYGAYIRLVNSKNPSFKCTDSQDLYTTSGSSTGNAALQYPIGLITADEVAFAGGVYDSSNTSYYLYNGADYGIWTMSPSNYALVFGVWSDGNLYAGWLGEPYPPGVRPVINLCADAQITGTGTVDDPFKVVGAS